MKPLLTFLVIFTVGFAVFAKSNDEIDAVITFQEALNQGDATKVNKLLEPSFKNKLSGLGSKAVSELFSGYKLLSNTLEKSCSNINCEVNGKASKSGKIFNVKYVVVKTDGVFYITNIQTKNA